MKMWREIVSTAIVGTERRKFEPSAENFAELTRFALVPKTDTPETSLLKAAALLSSYRRAGIKSATDSENLPETVETEHTPAISARSAHFLATLLSGNQSGILPEFFELAARNGLILTPRFLPEVLDLGASNHDLQNLISPVLGARGVWLAEHNDNWNWAVAGEPAEEIWQTGSRAERLMILKKLRRGNPSQARNLLSGSWESESAKDRADFLAVFRKNLENGDEEFLEQILQTDKSRDVRRTALDLLIRVPESALAKSLMARAAALFDYQAGGFISKPKIEIRFPEDFDKEEKGDVLNNLNLYLDEKKLGQKAVKLAKLLHCVPPRVWEEKWSAKREEIIAAASHNEWQTALLAGFKSSAIVFADIDWLLSVLAVNGQNDYYYLGNQIEHGWTPAQIEKLIAALLDGKLKKGIAPDFAAQLLYRLKSVWSDEFTAAILDFLQEVASEKDSGQADSLMTYVLNAGNFVSAAYLSRFEEKTLSGLIEKMLETPNRVRITEQFIAALQFRREMHKSFYNEE